MGLNEQQVNCEKMIIDELGKIYDLYYLYIDAETEYELSFSNVYLTEKQSLLNSARAGIASFIAYFASEYYFDNSPEFLYQFATIFAGTFVGKVLFDLVDKRECNAYERDNLRDILILISLNKTMLLGLIERYVELHNIDLDKFEVKKEIFDILNNNQDYIVSKICDEQIRKDFNFEQICYAVDYLIGEDDIYKFLTKEKSKKRIR